MFHRSTVFQREFEGAYDNKPCTEHFKTQGFCCTIWKERWLNQKSGVLLFLPLGTRFISELPTSQDKMGNCTLLTQNPGSMAIYWQKQIFWALNSKENYYVDPLIKVTKEHRGQWFDSWVCNMLTSESLSFCQYVDEMKKKKSPVMDDSLWSHGLYSPWNSPGQNTGVVCLSFLHRIFPTPGSNPGPWHRRQILYQLSHKGNPYMLTSGSQMGFPDSSVKNPPAMQETPVQFLGQEDLLEKG